MTVTKDVKDKSGRQSGDLKLGAKIKELRLKMGCDQARFAGLIGVSQAIVSQWEVGRYRPSPMALLALSRIGADDRTWWIEQAGPEYLENAALLDAVQTLRMVDNEENRLISIHGTAGAGPNRFPPEQAEAKISLPRAWFHASQRIVGLRVVGDSMAPIIQEGFLVLVDLHDRKELRMLENQIVAARNENGVVIKWLKKIGARYYLVSQNLEFPPIEAKQNDYSIVGRVVKWIGSPALKRR